MQGRDYGLGTMPDYYVDGAVGNDANDGLAEGAGNAWATIGQADTLPIVAGDRVYVKASATYVEFPIINPSGTMALPIVVEGYGSVVGDNQRVTIDGSGGGASNEGLAVNDYVAVRNFTILNAQDHGISADLYCVIENCEVDTPGDRGFFMTTGTVMVGCYVHGATNQGYYFFGTGCTAFACIAENCANGFQNNSDVGGYFFCIARGNTFTGLGINSNGRSEPIINCTVDGVKGSNPFSEGIECGANAKVAQMINCAIINCNTGVDMHQSGLTERNWSFNNLLYNNSTDYNATGSTVSGEVLAAPVFADEDAKDYGPDTGSPCILAGFEFRTSPWSEFLMTGDKIDIGALQGLGAPTNFRGAFLNWGVS